MFKRLVAGAAIALSLVPVTARAQEAADSMSASPTRADVFWQAVPALVPIRMILPPGFVAEQAHTLIIALHGYGSSSEGFQRVGERLAEAGYLVALPETTYPFLTEEGKLGFDWGLYHTGDPELDQRAFELLVTQYMPEAVRAIKERYAIEDTYLLGFSQGAIAAVLSGIYTNEAFDGVISFGLGGYDPAWFEIPVLAAPLTSGTHLSVLLIHGEADERVPLAVSELARDHLVGAGYDVTLRTFRGGHTVPNDQLDFVARWLRERTP